MQLNVKMLSFKAVAAVTVMVGTVYLIRSAFVAEVIVPCSARYPGVSEFTLENGSKPLSPVA